MIPSLQKISDTIPHPSERVKHLFSMSVTPEAVPYGTFARHVYAMAAITCSLVTMMGYAVVILSRIASACIYRDFKGVTLACREDADRIFNSLYFVAAMTSYLFANIVRGTNYELHLEPKVEIDPYLYRPEYRVPVLKSSVPLQGFVLPTYEIPNSGLQFFADINALNISDIYDINFLIAVLASRPDLVLLFSPDEKSAYLVQRDDRIRAGVMRDEYYYFELAPVEPPPVVTVDLSSTPATIDTPTDNLLPLVDLPPNTVAVASSPAANLMSSMINFQESKLITSSFSLMSSQIEAEPPPPTTVTRITTTLSSAWGNLVGYDHQAKEMKYRHILDHLYRLVTIGKGLELYNRVYRIKGNTPLKALCLRLYEIVTNLENSDVRSQNTDFIYTLRAAQALLQQQDDPACREWIHLLAYNRFAGVKLYGYCKGLVEMASDSFTAPVTPATFWDELQRRLTKVKQLPLDQGLATPVLYWQKLMGSLNLRDFLRDSNIPYIYGQLKMGEQTVTVLRHGTPVTLSGYWGSSVITDDYVAFIDAAHAQKQNILHLIAENHQDSFEGVRVNLRLGLASKENFFPWAVRFDGEFVEPKKYVPKTVEQAKREFAEQMYGTNTGYVVPEKLQRKGLSKAEFQEYMNSVCTTFFPDHAQFDTLQEFQAFVVLTYAEAALALCKKLKISILEAFCKDDIDRGGALKAIIVLLHLYRTGKFEAASKEELEQALQELMVNIIAAPLIVKKQPILKNRAAYILHALNALIRTAQTKPSPADAYTGNFNVLSLPHQGVTPTGSTSHTQKEYRDYLRQIRTGTIVLKTTLKEDIIANCATNYLRTKNTGPIIQQLIRDSKGLNITLNGTVLNPQRQETPGIADTVLGELGKVGIVDDSAWSILSAFTQTIGADLITSLQPLFDNERLGYIIQPDTDGLLTDDSAGLSLKVQQGKASIKLVMLLRVIAPNEEGKTIARIRTTIEIPDHRVAGATVTTTVV